MKPAATSRPLFLDTNLFVAAVRNAPRVTPSHRLILHILERPETVLVASPQVVVEYRRYGAAFPSPTSERLLAGLLARLEVVSPSDASLVAVARHFPATAAADVYHAATCFERGAILVTNDRHFAKVRDLGLVEVWSIARAMKFFAMR